MRVTFICSNLRSSSLRLQPNRYISQVIKELNRKGHEVSVITDTGNEAPGSEMLDGAQVITTPSVHVFSLNRNKLLESKVKELKPDTIVWVLGQSSFWHFSWPQWVQCPLIGVYTAPFYKPGEILRIGVKDIFRSPGFYGFFLAASLAPKYLIRSILNHKCLSVCVVLSDYVKKQLVTRGIATNKLKVLPPGIDNHMLNLDDLSRGQVNNGEINTLFLGSPQSYRGPDVAIRSVNKLQIMGIPIKLIILSRRHSDEYARDEQKISSLINKLGLNGCVKIISGYLPPEEVTRHYKNADLILLPFKIIPSEMPLTVIEAMQHAKPVITSKLGGVTDLLDEGRGVTITPNDSDLLASAILSSVSSSVALKSTGNKAREYIQSWPTWEMIGSEFEEMMIKFAGDGTK